MELGVKIMPLEFTLVAYYWSWPTRVFQALSVLSDFAHRNDRDIHLLKVQIRC